MSSAIIHPFASTSGDFVITRTFDAPRELVFKAWTEVEHLRHWWGPKGAKMEKSELDARPGGWFHYGLTKPFEMWGRWMIREVTPPERLVFVNSFSDPDGGLARHPLHLEWPAELLTTVTFVEEAGKTTVTIRWTPINPSETERRTFDNNHDSMNQGWGGTLDQLVEHLRGAR